MSVGHYWANRLTLLNNMQTVKANLRLDFFYNPVHHIKLMKKKLWIMDREETNKIGTLLSLLVKTLIMWKFIFNYDEFNYDVLLYDVQCLGTWQMHVQIYDTKAYYLQLEWPHNKFH